MKHRKRKSPTAEGLRGFKLICLEDLLVPIILYTYKILLPAGIAIYVYYNHPELLWFLKYLP
jgi:hypothetical protein